MADIQNVKTERANSFSQHSETSQTAQEFINSQLQLEAEAREALPYQFDTCTRPFGPLRQLLFSCLTCNPPPSDSQAPYQAAGVCYSCSISCHGEHELVELFNKRNFVCDCGTTRLPATSPCSLRISEVTGRKGGVHSEMAAPENKYNHNFRNNFCTCGEVYNAQKEQGTMFQCLGLGSVDDGGCGEDWYHPECIMGLSRGWRQQNKIKPSAEEQSESKPAVEESPLVESTHMDVTVQAAENGQEPNRAVDDDLPPGFPDEDEFEDLLCYKCVDVTPWIKKYAGSAGFRAAIPHRSGAAEQVVDNAEAVSRKRKASPDVDEDTSAQQFKKPKAADQTDATPENTSESKPAISNEVQPPCRYDALPTPPPEGSISLFTTEDFRKYICKCAKCFSRVVKFPQLLEEEETYEPPVSEDGDDGAPGSVGSRSLLDRGEAALSNMDRVRAIEGVMVYNHLKDKVKSFLKPFAESGQAVGAEDIKKYFEGLRGDSEAISAAARKSNGDSNGDQESDHRREQSGF